MAEHLITVIKMVSTATYSASSPSQLSRHPWQLCKRDGGTGDLLRSTVSMHAVSVNNATITSHGCDAQNFPCARNNCAVIFDIAVCLCVCLNWTKIERENRATKINTKKIYRYVTKSDIGIYILFIRWIMLGKIRPHDQF